VVLRCRHSREELLLLDLEDAHQFGMGYDVTKQTQAITNHLAVETDVGVHFVDAAHVVEVNVVKALVGTASAEHLISKQAEQFLDVFSDFLVQHFLYLIAFFPVCKVFRCFFCQLIGWGAWLKLENSRALLAVLFLQLCDFCTDLLLLGLHVDLEVVLVEQLMRVHCVGIRVIIFVLIQICSFHLGVLLGKLCQCHIGPRSRWQLVPLKAPVEEVTFVFKDQQDVVCNQQEDVLSVNDGLRVTVLQHE
jgi:hypothetical protein